MAGDPVKGDGEQQRQHALAEIIANDEEADFPLQEGDGPPPEKRQRTENRDHAHDVIVGEREQSAQPAQAEQGLIAKDEDADGEQSQQDQHSRHDDLERGRGDVSLFEEVGDDHHAQHG